MYQNPINLEINHIVDDIAKKVNDNTENYVMNYIQQIGIDVNKDELIRALQYDRDQYNKGFADAMEMVSFICQWLANNFDAPCEYSADGKDISEFMGEDGYCENNGCTDFARCWYNYFVRLKK